MPVIVNVTGSYDARAIAQAEASLARLRTAGETAGAGLATAFQNAGAKMVTAGASISRVGSTLTRNVSLPLAALGGYAVKTEMDFSQAMNTLAEAADLPAKDVERLGELAKKMGADTVFSATDAADAMVELAKAGIKPAEIEAGALKATMAVAATEGLALADSATIVSNAMSTFSIKGNAAATVADALAGGSKASTATVASLSQALAQVGVGAASAGLSIQDTVAVLAAFDSAGIKGADAGTSLKTMLARLIPTTDAAKAAMKDLGLKFTDAKGEMLPIEAIAGKLQKAMGGLSTEQRTAAMATIFGSDATRAATVLMKQGEKGIGGYIAATTKQGTAQALAEARMKGTAGAIESLKGSVETAALTLGEALAPAIQTVAGWLSKAANAFAGMDEGMARTVATVGVAFIALGPLTFALGKLVSGLGRTVSAIGSVSKAFMAASKFLIANPWVALAMAIALVAIYVITHWDQVKEWLLKAWEVIRTAGLAVWKAISDAVDTAVRAVSAVLEPLVGWIQTNVLPTFASIGEALSAVWEIASTAIGIYIKILRVEFEIISAVVRAVVGVVMDIFGALAPYLRTIFDVYMKIIRTALEVLVTVWRTTFEVVWSVVKGVFEAVKGVIEAALQIIRGIFEVFTAVLTGDWGKAWDGIKNIVGGVMHAIEAVITGVWTAISGSVLAIVGGMKDALGAVWNAIKGVVGGVMHAIRDVVVGIWNGMKAAASAVWNAITAVITGAVRGLATVVIAVWHGIRDAVVGVWNGIKAAAKLVWDGIATVISGVVAVVKRAIDGWVVIGEKVTGFFGNARDGAVRMLTALVDYVKGIPGKIIAALGNVGRMLFDAGVKIIQGLLDGIGSMIGKVGDKIRSVTDTIGRFIPGSPVREGALRVLNNGRAGKAIGSMLAEGMLGARGQVNAASAALARAAATSGQGSFVATAGRSGAGFAGRSVSIAAGAVSISVSVGSGADAEAVGGAVADVVAAAFRDLVVQLQAA